MDTTEEIAQLDEAIAASDRTVEANARLREQRDKLAALDHAEQAHRRLVAEKQKAARAFHEAEQDARRAEAAPLRAQLAAFDGPLGDLEREIAEYLQQAVAAARAFHARYVAVLAKRNALAVDLRLLGDSHGHIEPLGFEAFLRTRLRAFDAGRPASGAAWAREEG